MKTFEEKYETFQKVNGLTLALYCVELIVLTFVFRWYYFIAAVVWVIIHIKLTDYNHRDVKDYIMIDNIAVAFSFAVSLFVFITLCFTSPSMILSAVLAFLIPAALIVNRLIDRQRHINIIKERKKEALAEIAYRNEQDRIKREAWNAKYGHLTADELPVGILKNFSDLEHHRKCIQQVNDQNVLADYIIGRNGFTKNRNNVFPEDTYELRDAVDKITDKTLIIEIANQCGNWAIRAYAFRLLNDRINYLRTIASQPNPSDYNEAKEALFPGYKGSLWDDFKRGAAYDHTYESKRNAVNWAREELDLRAKKGKLTSDEKTRLSSLKDMNENDYVPNVTHDRVRFFKSL
jgi:hypothetical protein